MTLWPCPQNCSFEFQVSTNQCQGKQLKSDNINKELNQYQIKHTFDATHIQNSFIDNGLFFPAFFLPFIFYVQVFVIPLKILKCKNYEGF